MSGIDGEVIVVDNNSVDGSVEMVKTKFPEVIVIENTKNAGFSKANNQGMCIAKGEYVLLLNPDTLVEEDTFVKCLSFMEAHADAGGLGIKMLDGKGKFLPESKRGLPSPWVAFYKIFGFSKLFPKSRKFGRYHLGFLDKDKTHEIEILSGAYMFLRKEALKKTGLLDEDYFMYGEDIDLSYRIVKAGYKNYYYPEARIIHYKGESTKRTSINYVFIFYRAMIIFAEKHFSNKNAWLFSLLINIAIYIRAVIALSARFIKHSLLPVADGALIYSGMFFAKNWWETHIKLESSYYPPEYMLFIVPGYILIWLSSVYFSGGYDKPVKFFRIVRGLVVGTLVISSLSYFIDPYRFSRALILLGSIATLGIMLLLRLLIHFLKYKNVALGTEKRKRIVIVGNPDESKRVINLLKETNYHLQILGFVSPWKKVPQNDFFIGGIEQIKEIIAIYNIDEIIFCSKDIPAHNIIEWMTKIDNKFLEFKIVPDESNFIIGSNSKDRPGELYTVNIQLNIIQKRQIRNKRVFDLSMSILLFIFSPLLLLFIKRPSTFYKNIFNVLSGSYSWVGFTNNNEVRLPQIKKGVIHPLSNMDFDKLDVNTINKQNMLYARDYTLFADIRLLIRSIRKLG